MSAPIDAGDRLARLLSLLAYLAEVGEVSIADLARRFSMDEANVVAELELAACCGLPPYTPDQLLELVVDGGVVYAYGLEALRRPPRLTPAEGFRIAASARALLALGAGDPDSPLSRALGKLEAALGESGVSVELEAPEHLGLLRAAAEGHELVEIEYLGAARRAPTTRLVEPVAVAAREGTFYLDAWCRQAEGWRRFALDRVRAARPTGERFEARPVPEALRSSRAFAGGGDVEVAVVSVPFSASPLLERVAAAPGEPGTDGTVDFRVEVADPVWFGRLLLRLGPSATVSGSPRLRSAASKAAEAALERYR